MTESETVAKNRIEFQSGSKSQGTSSEALVLPPQSLTDTLQKSSTWCDIHANAH